LTNTDFDTGRITHAGEYKLTDKAYERLLDELAKNNFQQITPDLQQNILAFFNDPNGSLTTKSNPSAWSKIQEELERLKTATPGTSPSIQVIPGNVE